MKDTRRRAERPSRRRPQAEAEKQILDSEGSRRRGADKTKAKQQELALKLAKAELEKIAMMYADVPVVDPMAK